MKRISAFIITCLSFLTIQELSAAIITEDLDFHAPQQLIMNGVGYNTQFGAAVGNSGAGFSIDVATSGVMNADFNSRLQVIYPEEVDPSGDTTLGLVFRGDNSGGGFETSTAVGMNLGWYANLGNIVNKSGNLYSASITGLNTSESFGFRPTLQTPYSDWGGREILGVEVSSSPISLEAGVSFSLEQDTTFVANALSGIVSAVHRDSGVEQLSPFSISSFSPVGIPYYLPVSLPMQGFWDLQLQDIRLQNSVVVDVDFEPSAYIDIDGVFVDEYWQWDLDIDLADVNTSLNFNTFNSKVFSTFTLPEPRIWFLLMLALLLTLKSTAVSARKNID
ncbi:hypothetical protein [Psychromonas aquimarina]|uniref:hypothetical protein n=1 Tax=Psychromonas aquimarina TaxID=444919 RepID=UPI00048CF519|nr:hypothetical protein [Psychromonas aquimarina]